MNTETKSELAEVLPTLDIGDSIQFGELFKGLSEKVLSWKLISSHADSYSFEVYYYGVYVGMCDIQMGDDGQPELKNVPA